MYFDLEQNNAHEPVSSTDAGQAVLPVIDKYAMTRRPGDAGRQRFIAPIRQRVVHRHDARRHRAGGALEPAGLVLFLYRHRYADHLPP